MKKRYFFQLALVYALILQNLHAQEQQTNLMPLTFSVEEMVGDNRQFLQVMVNKVFVEKKKIGLLSISSYAAGYNENLSNNEYLNTTMVYHHLYKGIGINSGSTYTSAEGLKNFMGLQYFFQNKTLSVIYMPSYYFINSNKISNFAIVEYKPKMKKNWSLYARIQLNYNYDFENGKHFRSYSYNRLGLSYKNLSFGMASNFDRYLSTKIRKNNHGIFLRLTL